jgi:4'-phosphopantetheinyl transferase
MNDLTNISMLHRNEVLVFYADVENNLSTGAYSRYYSSLPLSVRLKIDNYSDVKEKAVGILGKQLLIYGLEKLGYPGQSIEGLKYAWNNRPYLDQIPELDFNISHSGFMVVCVLSKGMRVGVDIERIKPISVSLMKEQFSAEEWEKVENAPDPEQLFYQYWVQKEALIKAAALQTHIPFADIHIFHNIAYLHETAWYLKELIIHPDYCCWVATGAIAEHVIEKLSFPE